MACEANLPVDADWLWMISDSKLLSQLVGLTYLSLLVVVGVLVLVLLVRGLLNLHWLIKLEHEA